MDKATELLAKHFAGGEGKFAVCQIGDAATVRDLARRCAGGVVLCHRRWSAQRSLHAALGTAVQYAGVFPTPGSVLAGAVLRLENGRGLARALLVTALRSVRPGGSVLVAGAVRAGIRGFEDDAAALGPTETVYAGSGHRVFRLHREPTDRTVPPDWGQPWQPAALDLACEAGHVRVHTQPGVFSWDELDPGTALLLAEVKRLDLPPNARVLDACCGNGVVGHAVATWHADRNPTITYTDDCLLSLACVQAELSASNRNTPINHPIHPAIHTPVRPTAQSPLHPAVPSPIHPALPPSLPPAIHAPIHTPIHPADLTTDTPTTAQDLILCNPPFHQGLTEDRTFVARFAPLAARMLTPTGRLILVANRFLPYTRELQKSFPTVRPLHTTPQYQVLLATT